MAGTGKPFRAKGDSNGGWGVGAGVEGPGERQGGEAARDVGGPDGVCGGSACLAWDHFLLLLPGPLLSTWSWESGTHLSGK